MFSSNFRREVFTDETPLEASEISAYKTVVSSSMTAIWVKLLHIQLSNATAR